MSIPFAAQMALHEERGEVLTYRIVRLAPREEGETAEFILAEVYEHPASGLYEGWRPFDGEYACASIWEEEGGAEPPVAVIKRRLEAMLLATSRPVLHVDTRRRLVEQRLDPAQEDAR